MSLGNTSQPSVKSCADKLNAKYSQGRPGPELVPSRYALKVGAIDVLVVSDGVLSLPGAMLGHNVDPAVRAAWLEDMFLPPDVSEWALNTVVVRSGGRTVLIDAGIGGEFPDLPRAGLWAKRLEAAGLDLASVTDVVLTHMHMDHCGGLLANGVKERLRPDLRVHVAAAEAEFWEAARVRVGLLRELAATGETLVATHLWFPSVCHVAVAGDVFRCVPASWEY